MFITDIKHILLIINIRYTYKQIKIKLESYGELIERRKKGARTEKVTKVRVNKNSRNTEYAEYTKFANLGG